MTQGNIETTNYYTIKLGSMFLENIKKGFDFDEETRTCRFISSSSNELYARKWKFNELSENETSEEYSTRKDFLETCDLLKAQGTQFKVLKTTTVTTVEQKEVLFIDGNEKGLEGLAVGGLVGGNGKLTFLHNDFVLNKGDAEKLFQSAEKTVALLSKSVDEISDAFQQMSKAALAIHKKEEDLKIQDFGKLNSIYHMSKLFGIAPSEVNEYTLSMKYMGDAMKTVLSRLEDEMKRK